MTVLCVVGVASVSLRRTVDDQYKPRYTGFDQGATTGTMTLFAQKNQMNADQAAKTSQSMHAKDHADHTISGKASNELFANHPLVTMGYTKVHSGKHGFVLSGEEGKTSGKEVYCQRDGDKGGSAVEGSAGTTEFQFHCKEMTSEEKLADSSSMAKFARAGQSNGWGYGGGWGGYGGGYYNGGGAYGGWGGSGWANGNGGGWGGGYGGWF